MFEPHSSLHRQKRPRLGFGVVLFLPSLWFAVSWVIWAMDSVTRETVSMLRGDSKKKKKNHPQLRGQI